MQDPRASRTALLAKFSDAINSSPSFCRCFSFLMMLCTFRRGKKQLQLCWFCMEAWVLRGKRSTLGEDGMERGLERCWRKEIRSFLGTADVQQFLHPVTGHVLGFYMPGS